MPVTRTMCPMNCHPTACGMEVTVEGDRVTIVGDESNPDSQGFLCMRGRAAHGLVGNPDRLLTPLVRETRSGPWREVGWDAALDRIAEAMERVGPQAVGVWQGHGNMANDYGVSLKRGQMERFANLYGCHHWNSAMVCWGLGAFGLGITGAIETNFKEDLGDNSDYVILWGANTVSQAHTLREVERAKRRGARIVVIDVRRTEAGALADEVLLVRPGTDAALALAMMHVIVGEGLQDAAYVAAHTVGFDALADHLRPFTPEWGAARTGLPPERIVALARDYAAAAPAMIVLGGSSIHKGENGWHAARAIGCLPALTGQFGRPGGGIGPRHGARSHGAGFADLSAPERRTAPLIPNQMEAILEALESGAVKAFISIGSNLLSSFPDTTRVRRALARAELVVAYDLFENQTIREAADIVLPGTIWLEEIGVKATNGWVHLTEPVLPPAGQARPAYEIYTGLAARLGVADVYPWPDQAAAIDAALDHPGTGGATVAGLRANGGRMPLAVSPVGHVTQVFATPSGKVEFLSARAETWGLPPLPVAPEPEDTGLRLAHGRSFAHFHSFYDNGRVLPALAAREPEPVLWVAPGDAGARGLSDGDWAEMWNARGTFRAKLRVTPRIPEGTVWIRDGWPGLNAVTDATALLPEAALDAFPFPVGQSSFAARVELRPAP
ncbi:molybdopterin-containing oxidoreductase family protein [Jannaschia seohaensis]|uniref:Anaerobic selenocysteine-containing dehydrogenase n=1 Tax=Jannaschia seohaensis TaxID=475081 RepID=A0A2Y9AXZ4_9RHOB|nr:molybdopterin-dependent oxidoreductase [Jannaschia seohaensis]PWJ16528.1 anaerobic selenocysteine-containing dehydrogenase [Jannaschia seohaensis]SSA48765.1 Anaerobic selenocysteine-containing dehydrogenase [Jannaschia seohaensis]